MEAGTSPQAVGDGTRGQAAGWLPAPTAPVSRPGPFSPVARPRLLVACWAALVGVQIITPLWYATPDASGYLSIARSLARGGPPTYLGSRNLIFGIGYPAVIA